MNWLWWFCLYCEKIYAQQVEPLGKLWGRRHKFQQIKLSIMLSRKGLTGIVRATWNILFPSVQICLLKTYSVLCLAAVLHIAAFNKLLWIQIWVILIFICPWEEWTVKILSLIIALFLLSFLLVSRLCVCECVCVCVCGYVWLESQH